MPFVQQGHENYLLVIFTCTLITINFSQQGKKKKKQFLTCYIMTESEVQNAVSLYPWGRELSEVEREGRHKGSTATGGVQSCT